MPQVVVQKLNKKEDSEIKLAIRYFTIIAAVGNVHLTKREIQLLAFTAVKGTISSGGSKKDFVEYFKSTEGSLENLKHFLFKKGWLIEHNGKHTVATSLALDFRKNIVLQVNLDLKPNGQSQDREDKA